MTEPLAYWNGSFVPQSEARVPLYDAGFTMGVTVTDLIRTAHHRLYRWHDHLARFRLSCLAARVHLLLQDEPLTQKAEELVDHNAALLDAGADLALVLLATPGPLGYYLGHDGVGPPTLAMHTFPLPFARYRRFMEAGVRLVVPSVSHLPPECVPRQIKQRSRLFWWLADQEVQQRDPDALALLLDQDGTITETASGNVLVVKGGVVQSPPRSRILHGVSLQVAEELCAAVDVPFVERTLRVEDGLHADEILHTSTPYCMAGVSALNGTALPFPGLITERLLAAWSESLRLDVRRQIADAKTPPQASGH